MAYLQRLIWFAVGVLLSAVPLLAFADQYPTPWQASGVYYSGAWPGTVASTPQASCQLAWATGIAPQVANGNEYDTVDMGSTTGTCMFKGKVGSSYPNRGTFANVGLACPWGGTPSQVGGVWQCINAPACETGIRDSGTGECFTCPAGRTWNGTTCESPCEVKAGNSYGTANSWAMLDVDSVPSGAPTFCDGSCSVTGGKVECESTSAGGTTGEFVSLGSTCVVQGPFTYTGQDCGPGGSAPQLVGVDDVQKPWWDKGLDFKECSEQGGYWGNVGGIDACVRPQPGETFDKETSTGNETGTETETAADGTTTEKQTTTSTECKDGKCTTTTTTTTTTKGADGQQIGEPTTESKTDVKQEAEFCKANPQHAQCADTKTGGSFAGTCDKGFKCTGDAVQCAVAQLAQLERCEALEMAKENALTDLAGEGWAGAADITAEEEARALNRDGAFDFDLGDTWTESRQEYITFTKECISVPPIDILGAHIEFDVGVLCDVGAVLRLFMHLLAYLGAIRMIVSKV